MRYRSLDRLVWFLAAFGFAIATASWAATPPPSLYERVAARIAANPELAAKLGKPPVQLATVQWMLGTWDVTATVFATSLAAESHSQGTSVVTAAVGGTWLQQADSYPDGGRDLGFLTFNPVTDRWVAVALDGTGNSGITTATDWAENRLVLTGSVTIVGEHADLRQTLTKASDNEYSVLNEEQLPDGSWRALDSYHYRRRPGG